MALIFNQSVLQDEVTTPLPSPKRVLVQYTDDATGEKKRQTVDYDSLTTGDKATFDAFKTLCESKMV